MSIKQLNTALSLLCIGMMLPMAASAYQAGDIVLRAGPAHVRPDGSSSAVQLAGNTLPGTEVQVGDDTQLGITLTYMLKDHWAVGLLAATPFEHEITETGIGVNKIGSTKHLPPTLTLQYFPAQSESRLQPYVGFGVNYTTFFSEATSTELNQALGNADMSLDDSFGLALEAGIDIAINDKWSLNAAVWMLDIETDAAIATDAGPVTVEVNIDPIVYVAGIAYKF